MKRILLLLVILFAIVASGADVNIVKDGVGAGKTGIDLSGLRVAGGADSKMFLATLQKDLVMSGWFTIDPAGSGTLVTAGKCEAAANSLTVYCHVSSRGHRKVYLNKTFRGVTKDARMLAHKVADEIVFSVKGVRGIASTRIAMIGSHSGRKEVYLCDADGGNLVRLTNKGSICMSPNWGAKAGKLVYTSFHGGFPDVYVYDFKSRRQTKVAGYPGMNMGADMSPDSKRIILALSKDGNPDLYVKYLKNGALVRQTKTPHAAEASPSWSPDGRRFVFVSDKSGSPQLYLQGKTRWKPRRLTYQGNENVAPDWGANNMIVYSSRRNGRYQICIIDPDGKQKRQITNEYVDHEDPSWAPDGRHIVYARTERYRSTLYILDIENDAPVRLMTRSGDWFSPAWSSR
ncbi:MAG: PD40 domain-containing protein [Kiritimatiellae bacterium]|nr:PD40 domain-containing protein [Kiritimatiellia bacterium]